MRNKVIAHGKCEICGQVCECPDDSGLTKKLTGKEQVCCDCALNFYAPIASAEDLHAGRREKISVF